MCGLDVVLVVNSPGVKVSIDILDDQGLVPFDDGNDTERRQAVSRRGPDYNNMLEITSAKFQMTVFSSVLQIQGDRLCEQPIRSQSSGSFLCWNGEYLNHEHMGKSDTELIFAMLESSRMPHKCLDSVEGPFSFVYYDSSSTCLWFGKDKIGRRSLLVGSENDGAKITISSTYIPNGLEVPAGRGIYQIDLSNFTLRLHEWPTAAPFLNSSFLSVRSPEPPMLNLYENFRKSIGRHMTSTTVRAPLGILFSGGVDSVIIASIATDLFHTLTHCLTEIHLINVATTTFDYTPDRATGLVSYGEFLARYPGSSKFLKFFSVDVHENDLAINENHIMNLCSPNKSHMDFNISSALWFGGRGIGKILSPSYLEDSQWPHIRSHIVKQESVESAVDNRTSKKAVPILDNIICPSCNKHKLKAGCVFGTCKFCCKKRLVSNCSVHGMRSTTLSSTIPSLQSFLEPYLSPTITTSDCRILFVGHGADELFGGYGRHETRMKSSGPEALRSEMVLDLSRLWKRNLGRDDRILSDHARDTRHPFLDEAIVDWVNCFCGPDNMMSSLNGSNKPILRTLAREFLGMNVVANFRKRAIQFGTRLAQQTNIKCFGSHSRGHGTIQYEID